jgi:hypothetical protein
MATVGVSTISICRAAFAPRSDPSPPPSWLQHRPRHRGVWAPSAPPARTLIRTWRRASPFAFLAKALTRHGVVAWEGVGAAAGKPLDLTPEHVERLMDLDDIAAAFWDQATRPVAAVATEGNG